MSVGNNSFTYRERLHTASQFQRVFDQATKSSSEVFTILSRENTITHPRLGLIVAKRNMRRAVDRNKLKRIVRESFRNNKAQLPAYDFVVLLKRPLMCVQREKLRQQLEGLWKSLAVE